METRLERIEKAMSELERRMDGAKHWAESKVTPVIAVLRQKGVLDESEAAG
jgi:hypothetical protein